MELERSRPRQEVRGQRKSREEERRGSVAESGDTSEKESGEVRADRRDEEREEGDELSLAGSGLVLPVKRCWVCVERVGSIRLERGYSYIVSRCVVHSS